MRSGSVSSTLCCSSSFNSLATKSVLLSVDMRPPNGSQRHSLGNVPDAQKKSPDQNGMARASKRRPFGYGATMPRRTKVFKRLDGYPHAYLPSTLRG